MTRPPLSAAAQLLCALALAASPSARAVDICKTAKAQGTCVPAAACWPELTLGQADCKPGRDRRAPAPVCCKVSGEQVAWFALVNKEHAAQTLKAIEDSAEYKRLIAAASQKRTDVANIAVNLKAIDYLQRDGEKLIQIVERLGSQELRTKRWGELLAFLKGVLIRQVAADGAFDAKEARHQLLEPSRLLTARVKSSNDRVEWLFGCCLDHDKGLGQTLLGLTANDPGQTLEQIIEMHLFTPAMGDARARVVAAASHAERHDTPVEQFTNHLKGKAGDSKEVVEAMDNILAKTLATLRNYGKGPFVGPLHPDSLQRFFLTNKADVVTAFVGSNALSKEQIEKFLGAPKDGASPLAQVSLKYCKALSPSCK